MRIIALSGYAQSGKDSTAHFLVQDAGFKRYAFADIMRRAMEILNPALEVGLHPDGGGVERYTPLSRILVLTGGWDQAKVRFPSVRKMLQIFGTEIGRDLLGEDVWIEATFRQVQRDGTENVVISDCRFPNELLAVRNLGGQVWRIERPGVSAVNAHISDHALDGETFDQVIQNDGDLVALRNSVATALDLAHLL